MADTFERTTNKTDIAGMIEILVISLRGSWS